jgi:hypothetical protein
MRGCFFRRYKHKEFQLAYILNLGLNLGCVVMITNHLLFFRLKHRFKDQQPAGQAIGRRGDRKRPYKSSFQIKRPGNMGLSSAMHRLTAPLQRIEYFVVR